ncbi:hypothetical protein ACJMK2_028076 [Sinanodonta woodiana]|uniref:CCHC-type domain-containing protein n=1 Tax=Sinanodonta woodiana TaxID=1069815 RepID=A0ABD3X7U5_SINWO
MRKIKKQTGELHLSGLPLEIPLEDIVIWFEEKFGIKVENAKLGVAFGFSIYNGIIILEIEKTKLYMMKRVFFLKGIQTRTWYKGCIYHRKCHRCGKTGHSPNKCTTNEDTTISNVNNIAINEQNDEETEQQNKISTKPKENTNIQVTTKCQVQETLTMTGDKEKGKGTTKVKKGKTPDKNNKTLEKQQSQEIKSTDKHQINETGTKQIESNKQTRNNTVDKQQTNTRIQQSVEQKFTQERQGKKLTPDKQQTFEMRNKRMDHIATEQQFIQERLERRKEKRRQMREEEQKMVAEALCYDEALEDIGEYE